MGIYRVSFWKDIGYLEGSAETPLPSETPLADLIEPDVVIEGLDDEIILNPSKGRIFNQLKLTEDWMSLKDMSYMYIQYAFNNSDDTFSIYAWVDSVDLQSDTDEYPMTIVSFHIDFWRTYINDAVIGRGTVLRKPYVENTASTAESSLIPPQQINTNMWYPYTLSNKTIIPNPTLTVGADVFKIWFILFTYTPENLDGEITYTTYGCFPVIQPKPGVTTPSIKIRRIQLLTPYNDDCPRLSDVVDGGWDEKLKLTPSRIKAVWLSPVAPFSYEIETIEEGGITKYVFKPNIATCGNPSYKSALWVGQLEQDASYGYLTSYKLGGVNVFPTFDGDLGTGVINTDKVKYTFTGFDGDLIGELPWGVQFKTYNYRIVAGSVSAYIEIRGSKLISARSRGVCFVVPLPPIEITENSYSEYNYTGARDFDRGQRAAELNYQRQTAYADALTQVGLGGVTSLVSIGAGGLAGGAMAGAGQSALSTAGKVGVGVASQAGNAGLIGFSQLLSGGSSLISTAIHDKLNLEENYNSSLDNLANQYQSRQSDGLIMAGQGFDIIGSGQPITMYQMKCDSYSATQFANKMSQYGAQVFEPSADCSTYIVAGPLQIDNLNVTGNIPVDAKLYIANRLKRGVILV